jgi:hypothetical protein
LGQHKKCQKSHSRERYDLQVRRYKGKNNFTFKFFLRLCKRGQDHKGHRGLKSTSALGTDGIPVAILKMGSNVLAGPISYLVSMSLLAGIFPEAFKTGLLHPVYKGGRKARHSPASYRPVAILCAMSKVLETVAKEDLEAFINAKNILPSLQHGFRKGRSCTTALDTAHAAWVLAKSKVWPKQRGQLFKWRRHTPFGL